MSSLRRIAVRLRSLALVDTRTLALFRVAFGLHLALNLHDRTRGLDGVAFYTNLGVLPNYRVLAAPLAPRTWSLLLPLSSPAEVQVAFVAMLAVYVAYVVGFRTKLAQLLAVVCLVSLDNRNLMLQNGGVVATNLLAVWTSLLPLGERFSVDAWLARRARAPRASVSRLAFVGVCANWAAIYHFNFAHKIGGAWRDGSAVHWVLWQNRVATTFAAWLRAHEPRWLSPVATHGTLVVEVVLPWLILSPWGRPWTRRVALALILALHGGIAAALTLGPFSYTMMAFGLLLVSPEDWDALAALLRRRGHARAAASLAPGEPRGEAPERTGARRTLEGFAGRASDALAVALAVVVASQISLDCWILPKWVRWERRPEAFAAVVDYLRIPQGWSMFSPDAPRDDGDLVVDAILADGTHVDPIRDRAPDFEAALHGPFFDDQQWCDYDLRISSEGQRALWPELRELVLRLPDIRGWDERRRIRYFDVWWMSNKSPPPGSTTPHDLRARRLFAWGTPPAGASVHAETR